MSFVCWKEKENGGEQLRQEAEGTSTAKLAEVDHF